MVPVALFSAITHGKCAIFATIIAACLAVPVTARAAAFYVGEGEDELVGDILTAVDAISPWIPAGKTTVFQFDFCHQNRSE